MNLVWSGSFELNDFRIFDFRDCRLQQSVKAGLLARVIALLGAQVLRLDLGNANSDPARELIAACAGGESRNGTAHLRRIIPGNTDMGHFMVANGSFEPCPMVLD